MPVPRKFTKCSLCGKKGVYIVLFHPNSYHQRCKYCKQERCINFFGRGEGLCWTCKRIDFIIENIKSQFIPLSDLYTALKQQKADSFTDTLQLLQRIEKEILKFKHQGFSTCPNGCYCFDVYVQSIFKRAKEQQ